MCIHRFIDEMPCNADGEPGVCSEAEFKCVKCGKYFKMIEELEFILKPEENI